MKLIGQHDISDSLSWKCQSLSKIKFGYSLVYFTLSDAIFHQSYGRLFQKILVSDVYVDITQLMSCDYVEYQ